MTTSVKGEVLERYDNPMTMTHWKRNKKPSINLMHDSAFATDRQLEDQKYLLEMNRVCIIIFCS
jgi:hypothetical protein